MGELYQQNAETAARRSDQHPVVWLDGGLLDKSQCRGGIVKQRRGLTETEFVRHEDQPIGRDYNLLGVSTALAGAGDNTSANLPLINTFTNRDDFSSHPAAWYVGRLH